MQLLLNPSHVFPLSFPYCEAGIGETGGRETFSGSYRLPETLTQFVVTFFCSVPQVIFFTDKEINVNGLFPYLLKQYRFKEESLF